MKIKIVKKKINSDVLHNELRMLIGQNFSGISHNGKVVTVGIGGEITQQLRGEIEAVVNNHVAVEKVRPSVVELDSMISDYGPVEDWEVVGMSDGDRARILQWLMKRSVES
jgi:hypothetical protein